MRVGFIFIGQNEPNPTLKSGVPAQPFAKGWVRWVLNVYLVYPTHIDKINSNKLNS